MKARYVKIPYIVLHGMLALVLLWMTVTLLIRQVIPALLYNPETQDGRSVRFLFQTACHIGLSFAGAIPSLRLPDTSRNQIERTLLAPMYLSLTLVDIQVVVAYVMLSKAGAASFSFLARTHVFALLFAMSLLLLMGLFHIGINTGKLIQFTILAATGSLLVAAVIPLSVALNPTEPALWYVDRQFLLVPATLGILGAFTYIALYARERTQHNLFRSISFTCIVLGNILYASRWGSFFVWMGILLFAVGVATGIPRDRFSRLQ